MDRTAEDIIEKYLEYKHNPEAMQAMTDILVFMGIPEAIEFQEAAEAAIEAEKQELQQLRKEYARHIGASFKNYVPFDKFVTMQKEKARN